MGRITLLNKNRLWGGLGQFRLKSVGLIAGLGIGSIILYDIWTNMGWWYLMYPHDVPSLIMVYTAGLPFMVYHLISGIITFCAIGLPIILYAAKKHDQMQLRPFHLKMIHKIPAMLLVLTLVALSFTGTALKVPQKSEVWLEKSNTTSVRFIIKGDGWTITDNIVAYPGDTAFSLLQRSSEKN